VKIPGSFVLGSDRTKLARSGSPSPSDTVSNFRRNCTRAITSGEVWVQIVAGEQSCAASGKSSGCMTLQRTAVIHELVGQLWSNCQIRKRPCRRTSSEKHERETPESVQVP
jgi:hypothetical protein